MKFLKDLYQKYYYISPLDLSDSAESNRLFALFWTRICFIFCLAFLIFDLIWYKNNWYEYRHDIGYMCVCCLYLFASFLISIFSKNVSSEKAYIYKKHGAWWSASDMPGL